MLSQAVFGRFKNMCSNHNAFVACKQEKLRFQRSTTSFSRLDEMTIAFFQFARDTLNRSKLLWDNASTSVSIFPDLPNGASPPAIAVISAFWHFGELPPSRRQLMRFTRCGTVAATKALACDPALYTTCRQSAENGRKIAYTVEYHYQQVTIDCLNVGNNGGASLVQDFIGSTFQHQLDRATRALFQRHRDSVYMLSGEVDATSEYAYLIVTLFSNYAQQRILELLALHFGLTVDDLEFAFVWEIGDETRHLHWHAFAYIPPSCAIPSVDDVRDMWLTVLLEIEAATKVSPFQNVDGTRVSLETHDAYIRKWSFQPGHSFTYLAKGNEKTPLTLKILGGRRLPPVSWGCFAPSLLERNIGPNQHHREQPNESRPSTAYNLLRHT
jgi:hypothetical protein